MASNNRCYNCVFQQDDDQNIIGISISKDLMKVAGQVLKSHITSLAPLVLPVSKKLKFLITFVGSKVLRLKIKAYVRNFKLAFEHFCNQTGGRAVLDTMLKSLDRASRLGRGPSKMTLYRFGNTFSSSVWYELAFVKPKEESRKVIESGNCHLAFGSGFKCNSAVWVALNNVESGSLKNPWRDDIPEFHENIVASQNF